MTLFVMLSVANDGKQAGPSAALARYCGWGVGTGFVPIDGWLVEAAVPASGWRRSGLEKFLAGEPRWRGAAMKSFITLIVLGLFGAVMVGCHAEAGVGSDANDTTYQKKTTTTYDNG